MGNKRGSNEADTEANQSTGYSFSDQLYVDIVKTYLDTKSVKETAAKLKTSTVKVRKVLITEGLWSSKTSLEIQRFLNRGKTTAEIAEILSTTEKAVQQYLPYTRGMYKGDQQSVSALNSADYRHRIRVLQEKILQRSGNGAVENKWNRENEDSIGDVAKKQGTIDKKMAEKGYPGALLLPEGADMSKLHRSIRPIRLHMELVRNDFSQKKAEDTTYVLKTYGQVKYSDTISRDIIVPDDMPLWALHYTLQKCFGWQNSHLHQFELPEGQFEMITDGNVGKYAELVGVVFRSPWMDESEEFWNDDYESGSFKTWIRRKYSGPYVSMCYGEGIWQCKRDMAEMRERFAYVEVKHYFEDKTEYFGYPNPISEKEYNRKRRIAPQTHEEDAFGRKVMVRNEVYAFDDIPIEIVRYMADRSCTQLLERLTVGEVFALHDTGIDDRLVKGSFIPKCFDDVMDEKLQGEIEKCLDRDSPMIQPAIGSLTDTLYYNYDFGDNWHVKITASLGAEDLVETARISQDELELAVLTLWEKYRPVCIAQDGCFVLDDVGGIGGFIQFLKGINQPAKRKSSDEDWEQEDRYDEDYGPYEDKKASMEWAKSLGWSKRKVSNKNLL